MSETVHYIGKLKPTGKRINEYLGDVKIPEYYETVDFQVKYYNGGCCFSEALDEAMKKV